nr:DUF881 domain-containing protein [Planosporangium thailandense]
MFRAPLDPGYAQAARRRVAGTPERAAWRRRTARLVRLVALVVIGFLLAVAYRYATAAQPQTTKAKAGLITDVRARRAAADALQKQADQLHEAVVRARDAALADGAESARLRNLEAATGLARVQGDGVVVRVSDAPAPIDPVTGKASGTNPGRVFDRDLQDIANQLWQLDAEAIAINGERLTATSTIRTAGSAILVDFRPIMAPYEVQAVGPGDLADRFSGSSTGKRFHAYVDAYKMQFSVERRTGLTLPAAVQPQLRYAQPPQSSPPPSSPAVPSASGGRR